MASTGTSAVFMLAISSSVILKNAFCARWRLWASPIEPPRSATGPNGLDRVNWIGAVAGVSDPGYNNAPFVASVKIRYAHAGTAATVTPVENGRAWVRLHEPQRAVTPGQAAVIYDGDRLLGGGWICRQRAAATT